MENVRFSQGSGHRFEACRLRDGGRDGSGGLVAVDDTDGSASMKPFQARSSIKGDQSVHATIASSLKSVGLSITLTRRSTMPMPVSQVSATSRIDAAVQRCIFVLCAGSCLAVESAWPLRRDGKVDH